MVKVWVDKSFTDLKADVQREAGPENAFEMTLERQEEVKKTIKNKFDVDINFTRVDEEGAATNDNEKTSAEEKTEEATKQAAETTEPVKETTKTTAKK